MALRANWIKLGNEDKFIPVVCNYNIAISAIDIAFNVVKLGHCRRLAHILSVVT